VTAWARTGQPSASGFGLTTREIEIISAITEGNSNREIASKLRGDGQAAPEQLYGEVRRAQPVGVGGTTEHILELTELGPSWNFEAARLCHVQFRSSQ